MAKKGSPKGKGKVGAARSTSGSAAIDGAGGLDVDDAALAIGEATAVDEGAAPLPEEEGAHGAGADAGPSGHEGEDDGEAEGSGRRRTSVVNGTHVTVAFPFSRITNPEPSEELHALAALVADLVEVLVDAGVEGVAELQGRAAELRERMAGLR